MALKLDLYVITDEELSWGYSHAEIARRAVEGGADVIQLREKRHTGEDIVRNARYIRELTKNAGALFIVNDRLDLALACGADGVHLGQGDMPPQIARQLCPPGFIIGVSAGTVEEAVKAVEDGADYVGLGPICSTGSKKDAGPVCGFEIIEQVKMRISVPVVAIGGLGPDNVKNVIEAGADGIAVISAVVGQEDIARAARRLKELIDEAKHRKVYEG
jgi:thiamine-phosphate pyrophosphorylase